MVLRAPRPWFLLVSTALTTGCLSRRIEGYTDDLEVTTTLTTTTLDASSSSTGPAGTTAEDHEAGETSTSGSDDSSSASSSAPPDTSSADTGSDSSSGTPPSVCGDGQLADDEECDDGNATPDDGCSATCATDLRVFVTSKLYKAGDLMSVYQADAVCLHRALDAGLASPERFKAWLSDSKQDARDRFNHTRGRLVLINGLVVAPDWETLLAGVLDNPIEVTEQGLTHHGKVWTGTRVDGTAAGDTTHCDDWSVNSPSNSAYYGYSDEISHEWTLADQPDNPSDCPATYAIYCIETL